nr:hypothetical protein [uncultured Draconibacterium sp.]
MKNLTYICSLVITLLLWGCGSTRVMNDVDCLRKVNALIARELGANCKNYDSIKEDIEIIMKFYVQENGKADSIVVLKSNLNEKGIDESLIIDNLEKKRYKCIREVYYSHNPNPDYVTIIYNPDLSN